MKESVPATQTLKNNDQGKDAGFKFMTEKPKTNIRGECKMAFTAVASKKVYITKSAYTLKVHNMQGGTIKASVTVNGVKQSSSVNYRIRLYRGNKAIDSGARTGNLGPGRTVTVTFTNVANHGDLKVAFSLSKQGGSSGSGVYELSVP